MIHSECSLNKHWQATGCSAKQGREDVAAGGRTPVAQSEPSGARVATHPFIVGPRCLLLFLLLLIIIIIIVVVVVVVVVVVSSGAADPARIRRGAQLQGQGALPPLRRGNFLFDPPAASAISVTSS